MIAAQLPLGLAERKKRGGARKGAGRKPKGEEPFVSRTVRPTLNGRHPVHVTMRVLPEIPSLRAMFRPVRRALYDGSKKEEGFRLIHFAILSNHLHLIVEAGSKEVLSRGVQGLAIRIAWAVNRALGRKRGKVFSDRYHGHVLGTPSEVRRAMLYVIHNYKHHAIEAGRRISPRFVDECSSGVYFFGLRESNPFPTAETWLLSVGYRLAGGEIDVSEVPGSRPRAAPKTKLARHR